MQSKPLSVKLLAVAVFLFAAFFTITSALALAYIPALVSLVGAIRAVGLFSSHPRSRLLVYGASAFVAVSWLALIGRMALSGWPVPGLGQTLISLIPGLLLLSICIGCAVLAARHPSRHG
jgi:hypothetical protein